MTKTQENLQADNYKTPFEQFNNLMSGLIQVTKKAEAAKKLKKSTK